MKHIEELLNVSIDLLEQAKFSRESKERIILLNGLNQSLQQLKQLLKKEKHDRGKPDTTPQRRSGK
jgi:hypothetical protein